MGKFRHLKIQLLDDIPTPQGDGYKFLSRHKVTRNVYDSDGGHIKGVFIEDEYGHDMFVRSSEYAIEEQEF